jgi:hypothetical protein
MPAHAAITHTLDRIRPGRMNNSDLESRQLRII